MENTAGHSDLSLEFLWGILLDEHLTKMLRRFVFLLSDFCERAEYYFTSCGDTLSHKLLLQSLSAGIFPTAIKCLQYADKTDCICHKILPVCNKTHLLVCRWSITRGGAKKLGVSLHYTSFKHKGTLYEKGSCYHFFSKKCSYLVSHIFIIIRQSRNMLWLQKVLKEPVWLQIL